MTESERFAAAAAARRGGRYADALDLLKGCEDWPAPENEQAMLLRAGILARRSPAESLEYLARTQDVVASDAGRFNYYVTSAVAYIRTRNHDAAASMLDIAAPLAGAATPSERVPFHSSRALLRWCTGAYDPADVDLRSLCDGSDPDGRFVGLQLRGWMHAGQGRFEEHTSDLVAAVRVAIAHPGVSDPELLARQVHSLLRLGLERGDESAMVAGIEGYDAVPWSEDLRPYRFLCVRALAWVAYLRGDNAQAQWLLKEAKEYAVTDAWAVMAHLDRAWVARTNGNEPWAIDELLEAHRIARNVPWAQTQGEERQALVMMATLFAPIDMARAQLYISRYMSIGKDSVDPTLAIATDRRALGFEKYALGRVHQVLGNETLAVKSLESAHRIFAECGYRFRAALAATALYELTHEGHWAERARRDLSIYPQSALAQMLNASPFPLDASPLRDLNSMQRQVAIALCEGLDVAALSERFSRSAFTMNRLVSAVYERLGTSSRSGLRSLLRDWVAA